MVAFLLKQPGNIDISEVVVGGLLLELVFKFTAPCVNR